MSGTSIAIITAFLVAAVIWIVRHSKRDDEAQGGELGMVEPGDAPYKIEPVVEPGYTIVEPVVEPVVEPEVEVITRIVVEKKAATPRKTAPVKRPVAAKKPAPAKKPNAAKTPAAPAKTVKPARKPRAK